MYPVPGHAAVSIAGTYLSGLPVIPALAATFFVDVGDKFLSDVFHLAPYGRCWFHTLLSIAVCSAIVWKFWGKEWGLSWALGHFLHLLGDISFIPWFYPFISYDWPASPNVVNASVQGVQETLHGFSIVKDDSGSWGFAGWDFSSAVLAVFKGKLIFLELGMLVVIALAVYWNWENKRLRTGLIVLFFVFWGMRLLYQIPGTIDMLIPYTGEWIRP